MQKEVIKTRTVETTYHLTEDEVIVLIRDRLGVNCAAEVSFNIGGNGWIRDEAVTVKERKQEMEYD